MNTPTEIAERLTYTIETINEYLHKTDIAGRDVDMDHLEADLVDQKRETNNLIAMLANYGTLDTRPLTNLQTRISRTMMRVDNTIDEQ